MVTTDPVLLSAADHFFTVLLVVLAVLAVLCLVRAIIGPKVADRLVAVNMLGTIVMVIIGILAVKLKEGYLMDIALIYAMLSFLASVIASKVYMGVSAEKREEEEKNGRS